MENKDREALTQVLLDTQEAYRKQNKIKDMIIILLIILMFLEAVVGYCGVLWYESQFETVTTEQVELYTEGDEANAEYNNVEGDQYNDRFTTKNNMRVYPEEWEPYGEQRRIRRRIGY